MLNKQLETIFVTKGSIAPAGLRSFELKPYQLGLMDTDTNRTVSAATWCADKQYQFVWGTPSLGANHPHFGDLGNAKDPIRSLTFTRITKADKFVGATNVVKPFVGYLGWNGISGCKGLELPTGQNYSLQIRAIGTDVRDVFGMDYTELVPFNTGCPGDCCVLYNQTRLATKIVNAIENSAFYLRKLVKYEVVRSCCPAEAPFTKVDFTDYCLSLCDEGDEGALAEVQIKYPTLNIVRSARSNGISTYKVECASALPAAYVKTLTTTADCGTCGSGYTLVAASKSYLVTIDNAGAGTTAGAWLTEVQTILATAVKATRLGFANGTSTYQVEMPVAFVLAGPYADATVTFIGERGAYCVQTTPTSTAWTACGTKYKIIRTLCMSMMNSDCNATLPDLAAVQAMYATDPNVVPGSVAVSVTNDCITTYTLNQYSNCLEDGCDTYGKDGAKFPAIQSYNGNNWEMCDCAGWTLDDDDCLVPPVVDNTDDCLAGVKFTGAFVDAKNGRCSFDPFDQIFGEPIEFEVNIVSNQPFDLCNVPVVPWTVYQKGTVPQGLGQRLLRSEIISRNYDGYHFVSGNQEDGHLLADKLGYVYGADPNKLYNYIYLSHNHDINRSALKFDHPTREMIVIAVEADKTQWFAQIVEFLNATLLTSGVCKLL